MNYCNEERSIDLKRLLYVCLRQWRVIIAVMLLGSAAAAGLYAIKPPELLQPDKDTASQSRTLMEENSAAIAQCRSTIENNTAQIEAFDETVEAISAEMADAEEKLLEQQAQLETYQRLLTEAERSLNRVSADAKVDLIAQISSLTDKITTMNTRIAETEAAIEGCRARVSDTDLAVSVTLPELNEELTARIAELEQHNEQLAASVEPSPQPKTLGELVRFALIGMILGGLAAAAWFVIAHLFSGKLDSAVHVRERYDIPVLADLHLSGFRHGTALDLKLERWAGEVRTVEDSEYEILAARLRAVCPEKGTVLLCSTSDETETNQLCSRLKQLLDSHLTLTAAGNPARSATAALAAKDACVLLAEQPGISRCEAVDRMVEQLTLCGADILGCVLL